MSITSARVVRTFDQSPPTQISAPESRPRVRSKKKAEARPKKRAQAKPRRTEASVDRPIVFRPVTVPEQGVQNPDAPAAPLQSPTAPLLRSNVREQLSIISDTVARYAGKLPKAEDESALRSGVAEAVGDALMFVSDVERELAAAINVGNTTRVLGAPMLERAAAAPKPTVAVTPARPAALSLSGSGPVDELLVVEEYLQSIMLGIRGLGGTESEEVEPLCMLVQQTKRHLERVRHAVDAAPAPVKPSGDSGQSERISYLERRTREIAAYAEEQANYMCDVRQALHVLCRHTVLVEGLGAAGAAIVPKIESELLQLFSLSALVDDLRLCIHNEATDTGAVPR